MNQNQKLVLVSGASRGLGLAIVRRLLDDGFPVCAFARSETTEVSELLRSADGRFFFRRADMTDHASLKQVVMYAEEVGPIHALVNNAGVAADGVLATTTPDEINRVLSINLEGTLQLSRLVVRRMLVRDAGSIVNISSVIGIRGYAGLAAYAATKAGLDGMTRALARELGPRNISVNSVAPGYLDTEMTHGLTSSHREQIIRRTPLGRLGRADDVTGVVRFLLSDDAKFVTGQTIVVDGGITC